MSESKGNPLLDMTALPRFSAIRPEHVEPAVAETLRRNRETLESLLDREDIPTWDNLVVELELMEENLDRVWSPVSHLNAVVNSPELREAYNACLGDLSAYSTELGQNSRLYQAFVTINER